MVNNVELHQKVSKETLVGFLNDIRTETNSIEFKSIFFGPPKFNVKLLHTITAFMNTEGGGWLIFGVEDETYLPVGLPEDTELSDINTTKVHDKVKPYVDKHFDLAVAHFEIDASELKNAGWSGRRRFAIMYVAEYPEPEPVMLTQDLQYYEEGKGNKPVARAGDIPIRDGAKTCRAKGPELSRLYRKAPVKYNNDQTNVLDDEAMIKFIGREPLGGILPPKEEVTLEFVGRKEELTILWDWFNDSSRRKYLLTGWGGKGKTAIAYEFVTQVKNEAPEQFVMVIWLSAKEREFREGEIRKFDARDFWDLSSLLDAIIEKYGFTDYLSTTPDTVEKKELALTLLTTYPALVVADDIDSLKEEDEEAFEFLYSNVTSTDSKVLFTARRALDGFGHIKKEVSGLRKEDAEQFIRSRIRLYDLDRDSPTTRFPPETIEEILRITESSPLYMEDLLRLCTFWPVPTAIEDWKKQGGEDARKYALDKELNRLTPFAIKTIFACCIAHSAVSLEEIQYITDSPIEQIRRDMPAIQNLFLVSRPRLIDGEERYDVNENTRLLILSAHKNNDTFKNLKVRYKKRFSHLGVTEKDNIASYIRKATALQGGRDHMGAEELLLAALKRYPDNPDLTAQLGVTYTHWEPFHRRADARSQFQKAEQLNCRQEWMYETWAAMECDENHWREAIRVAEAGISLGYKSKELYRIAGYAHSRYGQYLKHSFHLDLAEEELLAADTLLRKGLKDSERSVGFAERKRISQIFRALVINCEVLGRIEEVYMFLDRWLREYPNDSYAHDEMLRVSLKYPRPNPTK